MPLDVLPVIHPGALELRVVQLEAERFNQVQGALGGGAQPRHVPRVRGDFRFEQNNVH